MRAAMFCARKEAGGIPYGGGTAHCGVRRLHVCILELEAVRRLLASHILATASDGDFTVRVRKRPEQHLSSL